MVLCCVFHDLVLRFLMQDVTFQLVMPLLTHSKAVAWGLSHAL